MDHSPSEVLQTVNGTIQVSGPSRDSVVGLMLERDGLFCGLLLSPAQASELARSLLRRSRFHQSADK